MRNYTKSNPETIKTMFGSIAPQYDRTNGIMSLQMHRYWNKKLINSVAQKHPRAILDLCCGTGEIAFGFLSKKMTQCQAYLLDFCPEMLACARTKEKNMKHHQIAYIEGDAQEIPLSAECVDVVTIAYGVRNIKEPNRCFKETYRVLRSGGRLGILELTRPKNKLLNLGHTLYLRIIIPILGKLSTSNKEAYEYLCNSIHTFVDPAILKQELLETGFSKVKIQPLMGGIATLIIADKN